MRRKISQFWVASWYQTFTYLLVILVVGGFLWWHLGSLVGGFSPGELTARANASSLDKLINNPLFLPHKLIQYFFLKLGHHGAFWMRSASALWGLLVTVVFFDVMHSWYNRRLALIGSFLLLSSAWFLHFARLGTPDVMYTLSAGLLWIGIKLKAVNAPRIRTYIAGLILFVCSLYVPGLAWLLIPVLIWQRKAILKELRRLPLVVLAASLLAGLLAFLPLIYGFVRHPVLIREWLIIPSRLNLGQFLSNAWHVPVWLVARGPALPQYWLGHLPILDIFSVVILTLGIYVLAYYRQLDRVRALLAVFLLAIILAIFNGWVPLVIALPAVFATLVAGIGLLLQQWFTVFPKNPLARSVGLGLVLLIVALSGYYNIRHYFVAWPQNQATNQIFRYRG